MPSFFLFLLWHCKYFSFQGKKILFPRPPSEPPSPASSRATTPVPSDGEENDDGEECDDEHDEEQEELEARVLGLTVSSDVGQIGLSPSPSEADVS